MSEAPVLDIRGLTVRLPRGRAGIVRQSASFQPLNR